MTLYSESRKKYLTINPFDQSWGLAINSVGRQNIAENEEYPPQGHPTRYLFDIQKGRILNEYQLLYITKGKGLFSSEPSGLCQISIVTKVEIEKKVKGKKVWVKLKQSTGE